MWSRGLLCGVEGGCVEQRVVVWSRGGLCGVEEGGCVVEEGCVE